MDLKSLKWHSGTPRDPYLSTNPLFLLSSHVVFGHVVDGEALIDQIEKSPVDGDHKPFADIRILDCGMVPGYGKDTEPPVAALTPMVAAVAPG